MGGSQRDDEVVALLLTIRRQDQRDQGGQSSLRKVLVGSGPVAGLPRRSAMADRADQDDVVLQHANAHLEAHTPLLHHLGVVLDQHRG